jgi:hypothetical protein
MLIWLFAAVLWWNAFFIGAMQDNSARLGIVPFLFSALVLLLSVYASLKVCSFMGVGLCTEYDLTGAVRFEVIMGAIISLALAIEIRTLSRGGTTSVEVLMKFINKLRGKDD